MNIKTRIATATTAALALTFASPASARAERCQPTSTAAIEGQFAKFNGAWATENPDKVTALFGPGAVLLPTLSNTPRTDPAGIRDYFVSFLKKKPVGTIDTSTVRLGCNLATRVGTWTVSLADPVTGARSDVKARYSFSYRFAAGRWWIDHLHSSVMPEAHQ